MEKLLFVVSSSSSFIRVGDLVIQVEDSLFRHVGENTGGSIEFLMVSEKFLIDRGIGSSLSLIDLGPIDNFSSKKLRTLKKSQGSITWFYYRPTPPQVQLIKDLKYSYYKENPYGL